MRGSGGILLLLLVSFTSETHLFVQKSVTICGDESAKQLYFTLSGMFNQSYPVFTMQGNSVSLKEGDVAVHFRWVGLSGEQKTCSVPSLDRENKAKKSVVLSLGLYDTLQRTDVTEFKENMEFMMERMAERDDISMVIVRSISIDPFLSMKKALPMKHDNHLETYNKALEEVFKRQQQRSKTHMKWVFCDVEQIYSRMEEQAGDEGWLKATAEDGAQLFSLLTSLPLPHTLSPLSSSSPPLTSLFVSEVVVPTEGSYKGALLRNALWLSVAFCVAIIFNVVVYNISNPEIEEKSSNKPSEHEGKGEQKDGEKNGESVVDMSSGIFPEKSQKKTVISALCGEVFNASKSWTFVGVVLLFCFLLDYQHYYPPMEKTFNVDYFIFITLLFAMIGSLWIEEAKIAKGHCGMLNRDQTEEWRGWMQISFLLYHYFAAKPTYNAIRVFVACYVWMTGFGHFSYFWVRKDWSFIRFIKSLFRMNFLVLGILIVMETEYVHYYICPMHTFFFFLVWGATYPFNKYNNTTPWVMWLKLIFTFLFCEILWTTDWLFNLTFGIFPFLKENGSFHEWQFRSGLDRFVTAYGMLFAYLYPNMENFLFKLDKMEKRGIVIKGLITGLFFLILWVWYVEIGSLEKFTYNVYHPYTSFIPITCFIITRNMFPTLRKYYFWGFSWIGKITLETYLLQFHLMLQMNNKQIVNFMDGSPNMNFLFTWLSLLVLSYGTFKSTGVLSEFFFPYSLTSKKVVMRCVIITLVTAFFLMSSFIWLTLQDLTEVSSLFVWGAFTAVFTVGIRFIVFAPVQLFSPLTQAWMVENKE